MNAVEFFNDVARPNITAAIQADHDYKLAVNAVLSVDATYGILFEQLRDLGHPFLHNVAIKSRRWGMQDGDFKEHIAKRSESFRAIRDAAYATKHGRLGSAGRIVRAAEDVASLELVCGLFACGDPLGGSAVFIKLADGTLERSWSLLRRTELYTDELLGGLGLAPLTCPIPEYHDAFHPDRN
ncbi:MAG TPA: hypothetical protein DIC56_19415 [Rhizobium sp.]|nr:hypothetical protein [Rhizobium sp.]